jgi:hypothetical protein
MVDSTSIPPHIGVDLQKLINATQHAAAANLAAALITASARPHSVDEAIALVRDIQYSLNPANLSNTGPYQAWQKTKQTDKAHT